MGYDEHSVFVDGVRAHCWLWNQTEKTTSPIDAGNPMEMTLESDMETTLADRESMLK